MHSFCLCLVLCLPAAARGDGIPVRGEGFPAPAETKPTQLHPAVRLEARRYAQPRPLRVWTVAIDLACPELEFVVTPKASLPAPFETLSETTLEFARKQRTLVAINGGPFGPNTMRRGEPSTIEGLLLRQGELISPPEPHFPSLVLDWRNRPAKLPLGAKADDARPFHNGLSGFLYVLDSGRNTQANEASPTMHPRTAIGWSADRSTMVWLIVDGRQPGISEGVTHAELAELGRSVGCSELLELDGGGSTTLAAFDAAKKEQRVENRPVGLKLPGTLRPNGANFGLRAWTKKEGVTLTQLQAIMPRLPEEKARRFLAPLEAAMAEFEIDTPTRRAAFLAQLAHESGELRFLEELADGSAYEGRKDLGNAAPGDGRRYKGRGPLQLTGRANYQAAGRALALDLELKPEIAAQPEAGCRAAGWFWSSRKLNAYADRQDLEGLTRKINGGLNGLESRRAYWLRAVEALKPE